MTHKNHWHRVLLLFEAFDDIAVVARSEYPCLDTAVLICTLHLVIISNYWLVRIVPRSTVGKTP